MVRNIRKDMVTNLSYMNSNGVERMVSELPLSSLVNLGIVVGLSFDGGDRQTIEYAIQRRAAMLRSDRILRDRHMAKREKYSLRHSYT